MSQYNFQTNPLKISFPSGIQFYFGPKTFWIGSHKDSGALVALRVRPTRETFSDIDKYHWCEVVEFEELNS